VLTKFRPRLSYANVTATLALIVALGGTAYAAATITGADVVDGSLTSADIKDGSLQGVDVATGAISSPDITDHSITHSDLATASVGSGKVIDDSLTGTDIDESTLGEVPRAGVANAQIISQQSTLTASESDKEATASCGTGRIATGGGYVINGAVNGIEVVSDGQFSDPSVWTVHAIEDTSQAGDWYIVAKALCVDG
jgi:hypothetical protein